MRKINIIIAILFILSAQVFQAIAQPKALIENSVFTFESVPHGIHVSHEFIIKNIGDTLLKINNVKPP